MRIRRWFHKHHLGILLGFAGILRVIDIRSRDFWFDEAFTGIALKEEWSEMMRIIVSDTHPPLYYLITKPIAHIFSYSDSSIRSVSFVAGLVAIFFLYRFTKEVFSERAAIYASLIASISPFAIYYAQEARGYSLLAAFALSGMYFLIRGLRENSLKQGIISGLCLGAASLTHYMGIVFSLIALAVWGISVLRAKKPLKNPFRGIAAIIIPQVVLFLPWLPIFFAQLRTHQEKTTWIEPATIAYALQTLYMFFIGSPKGDLSMGMPQPNQMWLVPEYAGVVVLFACMLASGFLIFIRNKKHVHILLLPSVGFLLVVYALRYTAIDYFVPRYLIIAAFFFYILAGVALSHLPKKISLSIITVYYICVLSIIPQQSSTGFKQFKKNISITDSMHIVALNTYDYVIAKHYFGKEQVILYNVDWPEYDPRTWPGVNGGLLRVSSLSALPAGETHILWNTHTPIETTWPKRARELGLKKTHTFANIDVYKMK